MEVNLEYELQTKDLNNAKKALPGVSETTGLGIFILIVGSTLYLGNYLEKLLEWKLSDLPSLPGPLIAFGAILLLAPYLFGHRNLLNYQREERQVKMRFNQDGCWIETGKGENRYQWEAVYRTSESKYVFLIFPSEFYAHTVPKRILTEEQTETIRSLFNNNVKQGSVRPKKFAHHRGGVLLALVLLVFMFAFPFLILPFIIFVFFFILSLIL